MSRRQNDAPVDKVALVSERIAVICLIAAFFSGLYYAFQVSVSNGIFQEPDYLWNFSIFTLLIGCIFGFIAYLRKRN